MDSPLVSGSYLVFGLSIRHAIQVLTSRTHNLRGKKAALTASSDFGFLCSNNMWHIGMKFTKFANLQKVKKKKNSVCYSSINFTEQNQTRSSHSIFWFWILCSNDMWHIGTEFTEFANLREVNKSNQTRCYVAYRQGVYRVCSFARSKKIKSNKVLSQHLLILDSLLKWYLVYRHGVHRVC